MRTIAVMVLGAAAFAQAPDTWSTEKEVALGKALAAEVERNERTIDPSVLTRVSSLGEELARHAGLAAPFTVKFLTTPEPRAIALPGGFLYLSLGLIGRTASDADLAGILAHEIAHIAARRRMPPGGRSQIVDYASVPVVFMGGWVGYCHRLGGPNPAPPRYRKMAEQEEVEADTLAAQLVEKAGYSAAEVREAFERVLAPPKPAPSLRNPRPIPLR